MSTTSTNVRKYLSGSLWILLVTLLTQVIAAQSILHRDDGVIHLESGPLAQSSRESRKAGPDGKPSKYAADIDDSLQQVGLTRQQPAYYLVRLKGPEVSPTKAKIIALGADVKTYVQYYSFVVRMDGVALEKVCALPDVEWVGPFKKEHRISKQLNDEIKKVKEGLITVDVHVFGRESVGVISEWITANGGKVIGAVKDQGPYFIRAEVAAPVLDQLSAQAEVWVIYKYIQPVVNNDQAASIMHAPAIWNGHGLSGNGQIVGHADTGLDTGTTGAAMNDDFEGRIVAAFGLGRAGDWSDWTGHGTHTAGSILGNGANSGGLYRGIAYNAKLVHQSLSDANGALGGIPLNVGTLFQQAYTSGARIHSDSWGAALGGAYATDSQNADVWAWNSGIPKDMLIVVACGNNTNVNTVASPGTAKNVLTIGASESFRPAISSSANHTNEVAYFSSLGPTDDARTKPDLVAPGTWIVSARTHGDRGLPLDTVENGINGWTNDPASNPWAISTAQSRSPSHSWRYNRAAGSAFDHYLVSKQFSLPAMIPKLTPLLKVHWRGSLASGTELDLAIREVGFDWNYYTISGAATINTWQTYQGTMPTNFLGKNIQIAFNVYAPSSYSSSIDVYVDDISCSSFVQRDAEMAQVLLAPAGSQADTNYALSGGTSMATPLTAGAAALVREFFQTVQVTNPIQTVLVTNPSAALVKAVLINGATNMAGAPRPDNNQGWGRISLEYSLFPPLPRSWRYFDVTNGLSELQTNVHLVAVTNTSEQMRATLVWWDPAGSTTGKTLQNDLDLALVASSGTVYTNSDNINNTENVDLNSPSNGIWRIEVRARTISSGPQPYALVISGALGDVGDLALAATVSPGSVIVGSNLTYTITVTNLGPDRVTGVQVTNTMPTNVCFVSASTNLAYTPTNGIVVFNLGTLASNAVATATLSVIPASAGSLTNTFYARANALDPNPTNNTVALAINVSSNSLVTSPILVVSDAFVKEGDSGTTNAVFLGSLMPASTNSVAVSFATANGIALAGSDYLQTNGTLVFNPGETAKTIRVTVLGDVAYEPDEPFYLLLSAATNVFNARLQGVGTILNDDVSNTVARADMAIALTSPTQAFVGYSATNFVTVTNRGPSNATQVTVTVQLPSTVSYGSATLPPSSRGGDLLVFSLGNLANGLGTNILLTVTNNIAGTNTTTASVTTDSYDPNQANNAVSSVTVIVGNSPPALAGNEAPPLNYTENQAATNLTSTLTVSDADSANMASGSVQITTNYQNGQDVLSYTQVGSIVGSWSSTNGTMALSGSDTKTNYQLALRAVKYANNSDKPSTLTRTVTFKVNDGTSDSNQQIRNITVTAVNDKPVATAGATLAYTEQGPAAVLDNTITLSDADDTQLAGATVTITSPVTGDTLNFTPQNGIAMVNFTGGVLTLTGTATLTNYRTALRSVTFNSTSDDPTVNATRPSRTITWAVTDANSDGLGAQTSTGVTSTINITAVNDAPTLDAIAALTINEDAATTNITLTGVGPGPDSGQTVTNLMASSSNPASIPNPSVSYTNDNLTGTLSFAPMANSNGVATITVVVKDNGGTANGGVDSKTNTFTVTVNPVNDPPVVINRSVTLSEDTSTNLVLTATDVDNTNLTFAILSNPTNGVVINLNTNTGAVTYQPNTNYNGPDFIRYTASDGSLLATGSVSITVPPVNDAPTLGPISPLAIQVNAGLQTVNLTNITSGAGNEGQFLTVTAVSTNTGLIPNPTVNYTSPNSTGNLSFTPVANASGNTLITVTVQDDGPTTNGGQNTFSRQFTVQVSSLAHLAITQSASPSPVPVGSNLVYTLTVTNRGPSAAAGLFVTNTFPATASFVSATASQGTWANPSGKVVFALGTLPNNASALLTVTVTNPTAGQITNLAQVVTTVSGDPDLTDNAATNVTTVLPVVLITASDPNASEAGLDPGTFTVSRLGGNIGSLVVNYTVTGMASPGSDYVALSGTVTIPNAANQALITVTPADDFLVEPNEQVIVTLTTNSTYFLSGISNAIVTITDNDAQSLVVSTTAITVNEGSTATFTVRLAAQPGANVTVSVAWASGDSDLTVGSGNSLTFTTGNWNTPQTVTIAAAEDADTVNSPATFTVSSSGLTSVNVVATEADNDAQSLVVSSTALTVNEGSTATFTVRLAAQPTGNVAVSVAWASGDSDLTVSSGNSLTFTTGNWNTPQTVTIAAAEDGDTVNGTAIFMVSSTGLTSVNVTATEADNDIIVSPNSFFTTGPLATARYFHTTTLLPNGNVLVAGGDGGGFDLSSAELYDPATGAWTATGSMNASRRGHTATLLPNGKVLVAGGYRSGSGVLSSAELYDPATGTWATTDTLSTARYGHTATLLPNGKVLVAAGHGTNCLASAELYDPATETWTKTGTLNTAREYHTTTLLANGKVLVTGGNNSSAGVFLSSSELYDPATGTWATTGTLSTARYSHTATLLPNGKVLVAGGQDNSSNAFSSAELYDPASGTWTPTASMSTARYRHTATLLPNGRLLVAGGCNNISDLSSAELYDPATETWSATGALNFARSGHTATLLANGRVLLAAGGNNAHSSVELYDPANGTWTATGALTTARVYHTATLLPNGKFLVTGGNDRTDGILSSAELYDPATGMWTVTGRMNTARRMQAATLLASGKLLVAGGQSDASAGAISSAELYDPATGTWAVTGPLNIARALPTATLLSNGKVLFAGGNSIGGGYLSSAEVYDPATGTWTMTGNLHYRRMSHTATLLPSGEVLVMGGWGGTFVSAELYDPTTGMWTMTGAPSTARRMFTATLLPNGKVLVAGGENNNGVYLASAELYDPATGTWTMTGALSNSRYDHAAILLPNGKVLVAGGVSGSIFISSAELYDPVTETWTEVGAMTTSRQLLTAGLLPSGRVLVAGGFNGTSSALSTAELYDVGLGFSTSWQPQITSFTSLLNSGGSLSLTGVRFRGISGASGGNTQDSPSDNPVVQLRSVESGQTLLLHSTNWSANAYTSAPVSGLPSGWTLATVFVNGIPSTASLLNIRIAVTPSQIAVSPASTNFGTVVLGSYAERTFVVTNLGGTVLSNGVAVVGAPFAIMSGGAFNLPGYSSTNVVVRFTPTSAGSFSGNVLFTTSNAGNATNAVTGTGVTPAQLAVVPASTNFGTVVLGSYAERTFTVTNQGGATLSNGAATVGLPFSIVSGSNFTLAGFGTTNVIVRFTPTSAGSFSSNVLFTTANAGGSTNAVSGTGVTPAQIAVSPASTNFGTVVLGSYAERTFAVSNLGGAVLSNGVASVGAPFSVVSGNNFTLAGFATTNIVVRFTPTSAGGFSSNVVFTTSNAGNSTNAVTGTGVTPAQLAVIPASTNFGTVLFGSYAERTFVVTNRGGAPLSNGVAAVGTPFTIMSGSTFSLAGFGWTNVVVRFAPPGDGTFNASVAFTSSGGSTNVAVSGVGQTQGQIAVTPTNWDFGWIAVGSNVDRTFVVTNRGGATVTAGTASASPPFSVVSGSNFTVAGFGTTNVVVRFAPVGEGAFSTNLLFSSANGGGTNVLLTGQAAVAPAALFSANPTSGSVPLTVTFTDTSTGTITNRNWNFGDGSPVTNLTATSISHAYAIAGTSTVTLVVSGPLGANTNSKPGYIVVTNLPPIITAQPQNQTVPVGGTAVFTVTATGTPPLGYQWRFNGTNLANGGRVSGASSSALTLSSVQTNDAGSYSVVVSSAAASIASLAAALTVVGGSGSDVVYSFTTLAGMPGGSSDGTGSDARFFFPSGTAVDTAGNVYVADTLNHTIRKMTASGVVTTLAGLAGSSGTNDGTGSVARFNLPSGVAVDSAGTVYVADTGSHTIRKVTAAGGVTTLAGRPEISGISDGLGSAAQFNSPYGVAVDSAGNIYVADTASHTIRHVTSSGVVTTIAGASGTLGNTDGTGSGARFNSPYGIAVDSAGNVYVTDTYNFSIRKVTTAGVVTTVVGTDMYNFNFPFGVAVDSVGNIYVANASNGRLGGCDVKRVTAAGVVTPLAGTFGALGSSDGTGSAARFNSPRGLALDNAGNLYVADYNNHTIRKVTAVGEVTTLAGAASIGSSDGMGSAARFWQPSGVAVDSLGNIYVADSYNYTVRRVTTAGLATTLAGAAIMDASGRPIAGSTDGTGSTARFYNPWGVAGDSGGNVYVADYFNNTIRKVTAAGVVTTLAGLAGSFGSSDGSGGEARFYRPSGVAADSASNVYVADMLNHTIRKMTASGVVTTLAGVAGSSGTNDGTGSAARFSYPRGVAVDSAGTVYVADTGSHTIRKVTADGGVTTLAGLPGSSGSSDGIGSAAQFYSPYGVAVDSAGIIYVADTGSHTIRKVTGAGEVTSLAGLPGSPGWSDGIGNAARFRIPQGISVGASGRLYISDTGGNSIRVGTPVSIANPPQLAVNPASLGYGTLLVGQSSNQDIRVSNSGDLPLTGTVTWLTAGTPFALSTGSFNVLGHQTNIVSVSFNPAVAGNFSNQLVFLSNGGNATNSVTGTAVTPAQIAVSPASANFGTVVLGSYAERTFAVSNQGGAVLSNGVASVGAPFSVVSGNNFTLAGFATTNVVVRFTPTSAGSFSSNVVFTTSNAGNANNTVSGIGVTPAQIAVSPASMNLGTVVLGSNAERTFVVTNQGGAVLSNGVATVGAPFSVVSGSNFALAGFGTTNVVVRFTPASAGSLTNNVVFTTSNAGNSTNTVTGTGVTPAQIAVSPASTNFGTVVLGGYAERTFVVTNQGGAVLSNGVASVGAPFSVVSGTPFTLAGFGTTNVVVRFTPAGNGLYNTSVIFTSSGGNATNLVSGTGITAAQVAVSPASTNFGTVVLGSYAERTFVVTNQGGAVLSNAVAVVGAPFAIMSGGAFNLPGYSATNVVVRFTPTNATIFSNSVLFTTANAGSSTNAVTGTGVTPAQLAVIPASTNFGTVLYGIYAERTFVVTNQGGGLLTNGFVSLDTPYATFTIMSGSTFSLVGFGWTNVVVRFTPPGDGTFNATVIFGSSGGNAFAPVSGVGQTPGQIAVSPANWDFGMVTVGTSADRTFVVTNQGGAAVAGGTVSASPPFSVVSGSDFTVAGFGTTNVVVRFTPAVVGSFTNNVLFTSANGGYASNTVSGRGVSLPVADLELSYVTNLWPAQLAVGGHFTNCDYRVMNHGPAKMGAGGGYPIGDPVVAKLSLSRNSVFHDEDDLLIGQETLLFYAFAGQTQYVRVAADYGTIPTNYTGFYYAFVELSHPAGTRIDPVPENNWAMIAEPIFVWEAPSITHLPVSQTNLAGTTATFSVTATGTAPLAYQWRFNGTNLSGQTSPALSLVNVQTNDAGSYAVVVTNVAGSVTSAVATLTVAEAPAFTVQPLSRTNVAGSSLMFNVTATGTGPLAYQWQRGGVALAQATNRTLVLAGVTTNDAGLYRVVVTSPWGTAVSSNALLAVRPLVPPGVLAGPLTNSANGHLYWLLAQSTWVEAEASAQALGGHLATIRDATEQSWVFSTFSQFQGQQRNLGIGLYDANPLVNAATPLERRAEFVWASGEPVTYANWYADEPNNWQEVGEFYVHLISPDGLDRAGYWNDVHDANFNIFTAVAPLNGVVEVTPVPVIVGQPQSQEVLVGDPVTFAVTAVGALPLRYQWRFNGGIVIGATNNTLSIGSARMADAGSYEVAVSNARGAVTSTPPAILTVLKTTPTLTWWDPVAVTYGTALGVTQLNATASVPGIFAYSPPYGTVLSAGANTLSVVFTPTDTERFNSVTGNVAIVVLKAQLNVTANSASRAYGVTNPPFTGNLTGVTNGDPITATYSCAATPASLPADYAIVPALVDPQGRLSNYLATLQNGTLSVTAAPPRIVTQPDSLTVVAGASASPSVGVTGTPPLAYQWRFNGTNLVGQASATLSLINVQTNDAGPYTVVVTNVAGSVTSAVATLTVVEAPAIAVQPLSRTNVAGSSLMFNVTATGTGPLAYQWHRGGVALAHATNRTIVLAGVTTNDAGLYRVVVTSPWGTAVSSNALLAVLSLVPPGVLAGPLTNSANGHLYWLLAQSTWVEAEASAQALGGHLATVRNAAEQAWVYSTFSQFAGRQRNLGIGLYDANPLVNATTLTERRAEFVWASGEPVTYANWYADEANNWQEVGEFYVHMISPDGLDRAGYWNDVHDANFNIFTAVAPFNGVVEVAPVPVIVGQPQSREVLVGEPVTFAVTAVGALPLRYQWRFNGLEIAGATATNLTLSNVQLTNAGSYAVVVTNYSGAVTSSPPAQLTVFSAAAMAVSPASTNFGTVVLGNYAERKFVVTNLGGAVLSNGVATAGLPFSVVSGSNFTLAGFGTTNVIVRFTPTSAGSFSSNVVFTTANAGNSTNTVTGVGQTPGRIVVTPTNWDFGWVAVGTNANRTFVVTNQGGATVTGGVASISPPFSVVSGSNFTVAGFSTTNVVVQFAPVGEGAFNTNVVLTSANGGSVSSQVTGQAAVAPVALFNASLTSGSVPLTVFFYDTSTGTITNRNWNFGDGSPVTNTGATTISHTYTIAGTNTVTLVASGPLGASTNSKPGYIVVTNWPPMIAAQPRSLTVAVGGTATLTVTAAGTPPLAYQWRKQGVSLVDGGNVAGAATRLLTLANISASDAGDYSVVVSNPYGSATSVVAVLSMCQAGDWFVTRPSGPPALLHFSPGGWFMGLTDDASQSYVEDFQGTAMGPDGAVYVSNNTLGSGDIMRFDQQTGAFMDYFVPIPGWPLGPNALTAPYGITFGPDGNLYVASVSFDPPHGLGPGRIFRYDGATGAPIGTGIFVADGAGGLRWPYDVQFGPNGNLFVSDREAGVIEFSGTSGEFVRVLAAIGGDGLLQPSGITFGADGRLYVADYAGRSVLRYSLEGSFEGVFVASGSGGLSNPQDIDFGSDGRLYVAADGNNTVLVFSGTDGSPLGEFTVGASQYFDPSGPAFLCEVTPPPAPALTIIAQPQSQTNVTGSTATFSVTATGTAPLAYQWRFNDMSIAAATNSLYTIAAVATNHAGNYTVVVTNVAGSVTSAVAPLTVVEAPAFTVQPLSRTNVASSSLMFNVTATGTGPLAYQWQRGGVALAQATNRTLVLAGVTANDAGLYRVVVSNAWGTAVSSNALLAVRPLVPPGVLAGPLTNAANGHIYWLLAQSTWVEAEASAQALGGHLATVRNAAEQAWVYSTFSQFAGRQRNLGIGLYDANPLVNAAMPVERRAEFVWASGEPVTYDNWYADEPNNWQEVGEFYVHLISPDGLERAGYWNDVHDANFNLFTAVAPFNGVVEVAPVPVIVGQPQSREVLVGEPVTFAVTAVGALPLRYQWWFNGGMIAGATNNTLNLASARTADAGSYDVAVNNASGSVTSAVAMLTVTGTGLTLGEALGAPMLIWATGGNARWIPQASVSHDGAGAARSGVITNSQESWLETTVVGPGTLTFWWQVSSEQDFDYLEFYVNGSQRAFISGEVSWQQQSFTLGNGAQTLRWRYWKDDVDFAGQDRAWVDEVSFVSPPRITTQPQSHTVVQGAGTGFSVTAVGAAPLKYQWRLNGASLPGITNSSYNIIAATTNDAGSYLVVVSNAFGGVTSEVATLAVLVPPVITTQPRSQIVPPGSNVTFTVLAVGTDPLFYQWRANGTNMVGATNTAFSILSVSTNDAGAYLVVVTNSAGSVTSAIAALQVRELLRFQTTGGVMGMVNGAFRMRLVGMSQSNAVLIEASTNLVNWIPLYTNTTPTTLIKYSDTSATNQPHRFYRAMEVP